jgi:hypothetical protein
VSLTTASPLSQTGLIPRIYRRADFSHRATPESLPLADFHPYQGRKIQRSHLHVVHMVVWVKLSIFKRPSFLSNVPCLSR